MFIHLLSLLHDHKLTPTRAALLSDVFDAEMAPFFLGKFAGPEGSNDVLFLVVTFGVEVTGSDGLGAPSVLNIVISRISYGR